MDSNKQPKENGESQDSPFLESLPNLPVEESKEIKEVKEIIENNQKVIEIAKKYYDSLIADFTPDDHKKLMRGENPGLKRDDYIYLRRHYKQLMKERIKRKTFIHSSIDICEGIKELRKEGKLNNKNFKELRNGTKGTSYKKER